MTEITPAHSRRRFLKAAGIGVALPMLESIRPLRGSGAEPSVARAKRLVCTGAYLGYHREAIYPALTGRGYVTSPILEPLQRHRADFTILSGLDHRPPRRLLCQHPRMAGQSMMRACSQKATKL